MDLKKPFSVVVCVAVLGFSSLAGAGEYTMTYSKGELRNIQGVKAVHARMVKAAKLYCPTYTEIRSLADVRTCVNGVVSDLVGTVNHSGLTRYHDGDEEISRIVDANIDESSLLQSELDQG